MVNKLEKMLNMELPGRRKRGKRPSVKDMQRVSVTEENVRDRVRGRQVIHCGDPSRKR